jgi:hypothetical protein
VRRNSERAVRARRRLSSPPAPREEGASPDLGPGRGVQAAGRKGGSAPPSSPACLCSVSRLAGHRIEKLHHRIEELRLQIEELRLLKGADEDGEQRRPWRPVRCAALLLAPAPALLSSHADLRWRHGRAGAGRGHGAVARRGEGGSWPWQSATGERECEREGGSWFAAPPGCATGEADCILQLVLHHLLEREQ